MALDVAIYIHSGAFGLSCSKVPIHALGITFILVAMYQSTIDYWFFL